MFQCLPPNNFLCCFCNIVYHKEVNKNLLIILFKLSDFIQSCLQGIQVLETRMIFILTDTTSPTSCLLFGL